MQFVASQLYKICGGLAGYLDGLLYPFPVRRVLGKLPGLWPQRVLLREFGKRMPSCVKAVRSSNGFIGGNISIKYGLTRERGDPGPVLPRRFSDLGKDSRLFSLEFRIKSEVAEHVQH